MYRKNLTTARAASSLALFVASSCLSQIVICHTTYAVDHVIHISVDGLRGDLLKQYIDDAPLDFPNFQRFVSAGATTFNARTDYTNTNTLPNHTSMITGRPVDQPPGMANTTHHGFLDNGVLQPTSTLHNSGNPNLSYVASTFDVVHDNGLSTGLYASKEKFAIFSQSYTAITGAPDVTGPDNGRDKIDGEFVTFIDVTMHNTFLTDMAADQFNYSFLHYSILDGTGHADGWESEEWRTELKIIEDFVLADLFDLVDNTPGLTDDTVMILTADHGGTGNSHNPPTEVENYTIPVLTWGSGVAPGADLYALNPISRSDPGTSRPSYTAANQPIRDGGTGNLALDLLGLGPIDGSTINANQDLVLSSAFSADFDADQLVNASDLSVWQSGYGTSSGATTADGDANLDGNVAGADFLTWQQEFGSSLVGSISVVPEPAITYSALSVLLCVNLFRLPVRHAVFDP